jgi:hypothetical protein
MKYSLCTVSFNDLLCFPLLINPYFEKQMHDGLSELVSFNWWLSVIICFGRTYCLFL